MVYDWDGKRDICYQMYIQDKKALEEIMEYMRTTYEFTPSKRAYQTQFKRWGFPSKQNPAHKNVELVARVKELWERNTSQRDMLRILNEEGFEIKERELMRVRAKNRWLLRVPNGMKASAGVQEAAQPHDDQDLLALQQEGYKPDDEPVVGLEATAAGAGGGAATAAHAASLRQPGSQMSPEVMAKRQERIERLKAESAERWATRKRRRRTRGWAGLPADPPGPPRFPSETTIDESKKYLSLDNDAYRLIRDQFQKICEEAGFIKKTVAGPERWQAAKERLIRSSPHLQQVFWADPNRLDAKHLALDVVCTDVTKRMRTLEKRMTIAEAKNALGINPEESRQIRTAFYNTLKADHFTSKLEAGDEHWAELKEQWIQGSELLQRILAPGAADPEHETKLKALEVLCRDVMKRLRDDQTKRDPTRKRDPGQTGMNAQGPTMASQRRNNSAGLSNGMSTLASRALARTQMAAGAVGNMQIDPSLLQAASHPSFSSRGQPMAENFFGFTDPMLGSKLAPVPVYLRISPQSQLHAASKTWVDKLATRSVAELRLLVANKFPRAQITRIEGIDKDESGHEFPFLIDEDHEMDAYLTHVHGRKASFVLCLSSV